MKLTGCTIDVVMLPTRRPHRWTGLGHNVIGHYPIIRLKSNEGIEGLGEAPVLPTWGGDYGRYFGEDIWTTIHVIRDALFPKLKGEDPALVEELLRQMDDSIVGYPYAKAALEMALHDMNGKSQGKPVYSFLGGKHNRGLVVSHSIGLMSPEKSASEARKAAREGVKSIKVKISGNRVSDVKVIRAVREAIRDDVSLGVDANQGYAGPSEAIEAIKSMSEYDLMYVEQPVEGLKNLAKVSKDVEVPIIADESAWSVYDVEDIIERRAADGISVYTTKPGGLLNAKKVLDICQSNGLMCNINGSCETGVGNAANLHLGVSNKAVNMPCVVPVTNIAGREQTMVAGVFYRDDIIRAPFRYETGVIFPNDEPGLGIELDEGKVRRYRSKYFKRVVVA